MSATAGTQVGRARISFMASAVGSGDGFGVRETTLANTLQHAPERVDGRNTLSGLVVDVQRFEPRSQRYSGSKLGGQVP